MGKASNAKKERAAKIAATGYGAKNFNWFPVIISGITVVLVAVIAIVVVIGNQKAAEPTVAPSSNVTLPSDLKTVINSETGAVEIGEGADILDEYVDFGCPYCGSYHESSGDTVRASVADGDITLRITPLGILDNYFQGTKFSTRAANAFYCVAENAPDATLDFYDNLFVNQPREGTTGLTDDELVKIANNSGASAAEECIRELTYGQFVKDKTNQVTANDWFRGTPAVKLNDQLIESVSVNDRLAALGS